MYIYIYIYNEIDFRVREAKRPIGTKDQSGVNPTYSFLYVCAKEYFIKFWTQRLGT